MPFGLPLAFVALGLNAGMRGVSSALARMEFLLRRGFLWSADNARAIEAADRWAAVVKGGGAQRCGNWAWQALN